MKSNEKTFYVREAIDLAFAILTKGLLIAVLVALLAYLLFDVPEYAQCESIGGRYDGSQCWYNGSKIDVDKYVEEWK